MGLAWHFKTFVCFASRKRTRAHVLAAPGKDLCREQSTRSEPGEKDAARRGTRCPRRRRGISAKPHATCGQERYRRRFCLPTNFSAEGHPAKVRKPR